VQEGCKIRRIYGIFDYNRQRKLFIFVRVGYFHPLSRRIVSTTHAPLRAVKIRGLLIILSGAPDYQVRRAYGADGYAGSKRGSIW
jgi:hypothetical protein